MEEIIFKEVDVNNINIYINEISNVHKDSYSSSHLTSTFPEWLLCSYYSALISASKLSFVAIKSDTVCGFIISGDNFSDAMKDWQKNNAFSITFFSLSKPRIFILKVFYFIKSIVKMLFRTNVNFKNKVPYRLFSIAVLSDSQSFGIGSKMISYLEECLLNMNIHEYGLSVKKSDKRAVKFYKRNSFSYEKTIQDNDFFIKSLIK